jgi:acetyl-CoA synthetase
MGRPLPGVEVRIEQEELCVRADSLPTLFAGYWNDPGATAERLRDGWWHTGDLAREDGDGLLWYQGRHDDMISSSGYRIGPGEVEGALRSHPAVLECAVVGLPDLDRGQLVHADVVLRPGLAPDDASASSCAPTLGASSRPTSNRARCGSSSRCRGRRRGR